MSQNILPQITSLLAAKGYAVVENGGGSLHIQETDSALSIQAVLEGEILFFSMTCATVPAEKLSMPLMRKLLDVNNGIATSHFQIFEFEGKTTLTLNNFCKLQSMGDDDEDDILSCLSFLLADVVTARDLLAADLA
jgi:hypothetical protein